MAKQQNNGGLFSKSALFIVIMGALYWVFQNFSGDSATTATEPAAPNTETPETSGQPSESTDVTDLPYLPSGGSGELVRHKYLTLSYVEDHEQAEWVAYILTKQQLTGDLVDREDNFMPDPLVKSGSANGYDYRGSNHDRGHLCPAADRAFSREASQETFYMSNISPQKGPFNKGIWRELEENTRDWAKKCKRLYVVTGPVLAKRPEGTIGRDTKISVPVSYYKVLLDLDDPEQKGIAFVIPNDVSDLPLRDFAMSIDACERITKLDFFPNLISEKQAKSLEGNFDISLWPISADRYQNRVNKWNKQ